MKILLLSASLFMMAGAAAADENSNAEQELLKIREAMSNDFMAALAKGNVATAVNEHYTVDVSTNRSVRMSRRPSGVTLISNALRVRSKLELSGTTSASQTKRTSLVKIGVGRLAHSRSRSMTRMANPCRLGASGWTCFSDRGKCGW